MSKLSGVSVQNIAINILVFFLAIFFVCSCRTTRSFTYFKTLTKDTTIEAYVSPLFESKIQKNDVLGISVSSLSSDLDQQFNTISKIANTNSSSAINVQTDLGFMVDLTGCIYVHFLGKIKVEGLTKSELKKKLEKDLIPYLKEPIVTIQYLNKKVTVLGNVEKPGIIYLSEEHESLLNILVKSGDLKDMALAKDVLVIRDSAAHKIVKHINLEDNSIFNSSWYYLQSDDIVYVKKDVKQYDSEQRRRDLQTTVSLAATIVSLVLVIYNTFLK
jgi:polysaccharide export outer membrane protein